MCKNLKQSKCLNLEKEKTFFVFKFSPSSGANKMFVNLKIKFFFLNVFIGSSKVVRCDFIPPASGYVIKNYLDTDFIRV